MADLSADVGPQRRQAAGGGLDDQPELDQIEGVVEALAHRVQPAQHVGIEQMPLAAGTNPRAAARPDLDQPLADQCLDRFPQKVAADAQLSRKVALDRQRLGLGNSPAAIRWPSSCTTWAYRLRRPWRRTGAADEIVRLPLATAKLAPSRPANAEPSAWSACSSNHPMIALGLSNKARAVAACGREKSRERRPR